MEPLVAPIPPELVTAVPCRLDPLFLLEGIDSDSPELFAAPEGSLAFGQVARPPPGPAGPGDLRVVSNVPPNARGLETLQVIGVVVSPIEDARLVHRHQAELATLAVGITGTFTILCHPDDAETLFPFDRIKIDPDPNKPRTPLQTGVRGEEVAYFVPRVVRCPDNDPDAFAMVLQRGAGEIRILFLGPRGLVAAGP